MTNSTIANEIGSALSPSQAEIKIDEPAATDSSKEAESGGQPETNFFKEPTTSAQRVTVEVTGKPKDVFSDLEALARTSNDLVASETILTVLEVRKPKKDEWVRTHEAIAAAVNIYENSETRETYLILPDALEAMETVVKHVRLTLTMNYSGENFIWPVPVPLGNKPFRAHVSANAAAEEATRHWVRIAWNGTGYEVTRRKNCSKQPTWPDAVPDASEMLRFCAKTGGFEVIESPQHPVVQNLLGLS
jgi:hypothetical protein